MTYKTRIRALKKQLDEGLVLPPERVRLLVDVIAEVEKIAIFEGADAHTRLIAALDAALG